MSVVSARTRHTTVSSILKSGQSIKSRLSQSHLNTKVRFQLPHSKKVRSILKSFLSGENVRDYESLIVLLRDAEIMDDDVLGLLSEATQCISLLGKELRLFVEGLLSIKWTHRGEEIIKEYQSFLCNLLSAHNYHAKLAMDKLTQNFLPGPDQPEWPDGIPTDEDLKKCVAVHNILSVLLNLLPTCKEILLETLINNYPYYKKPAHMHEYYLHNLIWIMDYMPQYRPNILQLIFMKLILLDANSPKEEIERAEECMDVDVENGAVFHMDEDLDGSPNDSNKLKHPLAHTLDICLDKILNYFIVECHDGMEVDWEKTKSLYHHMIVVFDKVILPTHNIYHVQFVMFYLCSFKTSITEAFLNYLWKKVCTPTVATVLRQAAVSYIASLIARASFVPLTMLKGTLQQMAQWIHGYIYAQDDSKCSNFDIRMHSAFYSTCQALFYAVAFRQKDLLNNRKNLAFASSLSLGKIVTCRLNPLRVCQPAVVQNFAAVTRTYQLAYCYSVMEHNARNVLPMVFQDDKGGQLISHNVLDSFFPFDPFILKRSAPKIHQFYIEYQGAEELQSETIKECDVDDFLCDQSELSSTPKSSRFSYSSSPGFKYKH